MPSKAAILRLTPHLKLTGATALRFDQLLKTTNDDGRSILADALRALYPGQKKDAALTAFRQFRREVGLAAKSAGVNLSIETDGQTRSAPEDRVVRFEGEDRIVEQIKLFVEAEGGNPERVQQFVKED